MRVFVDTSALLVYLDAADEAHDRADTEWRRLRADRAWMETTSYVLLETNALVQARLGMKVVRRLEEDVVPLLHIHWIDGETHARAVSALLAAGRRKLSLVDCASFETMRRKAIGQVFTFDTHFAEQGFETVP
jgi:predicted nucleic acid-binding protein